LSVRTSVLAVADKVLSEQAKLTESWRCVKRAA
jgi:hypothetical protein